MQSEETSANGQPHRVDLPPVTPPSPTFILQLFLVPGLLVAMVVAFIWLFFGWIGAGPQTPEAFLAGLNSPNKVQRWKTAEHFAQTLKRDERLAGNVSFALDAAEVLRDELARKTEENATGTTHASEMSLDLSAEFLPAALANFHVPVGLPLLQDIIRNADSSQESGRRRRQGATWSLAVMGETMKKFDALPEARKSEQMAALQAEAGEGPERTGRKSWAYAALTYLNYRAERRKLGKGQEDVIDPMGVAETLALAARSDDELTRKFAVLSAAMWDEPGTEKVLLELCGGNDGIAHFEDADAERGRREIRYNAALALARRGSPLLPKGLLLEALDEHKQSQLNPKQPGAADLTVLSAIGAVGEMKKLDTPAFEKDAALRSAVERLTHSPNAHLRIEAAKVLGGHSEISGVSPANSRETMLILGIGGGVLLLLALAVFARWRKKPVAIE